MATTSSKGKTATNPEVSPTSTNSRALSPPWADHFGACDTATLWHGGANSTRLISRRKHLGCGCGLAAAWQISRWQQSPRCPATWYPSPRGLPGLLNWGGVNHFSCCIEGDGCCFLFRVGLLSSESALLYSIHLRHWWRHGWRYFACIGFCWFRLVWVRGWVVPLTVSFVRINLVQAVANICIGRCLDRLQFISFTECILVMLHSK